MTPRRRNRSAWPVVTVALFASLSIADRVGNAAAADVGSRAALEEIRRLNQVDRAAEAERAARAALVEAERAHGLESAETAEILDELAVALRRGGKIADPEAMEVCQRALRIKARLFGTADPRYATSLYNLGLLQFRRETYADALVTLRETLELREKSLGSNHPDIAKSLLALGSVQHDMGNYEDALSLAERAVAIEEIALGKENPERARGLDALAVARYGVGDFSGSIPLFEEAIALWERSPTPNQGVIATCYHNLGAVYDDIGDHVRAVEVLDRALRLREAQFGPDHLMVANTLSALGSALQGAGNLSRAKSCLQRAVRILAADRTHGTDLGWNRSKLGWLYLEEGNLELAAKAFHDALRDQEAALGPDSPGLWLTLLGLATVAGNHGDREAARTYYERTVDLVRKTSGPNHPDLGRTLAEYAAFLLAAGDSVAALDRALQGAEVNREHMRLTARGMPERQALLYISHMDTGMDVALAALTGTLRSKSGDAVRRVWDALIRSRTLVLDEMAQRAQMVGRAGDVLEVAKRLEDARGRLANLLVRAPTSEAPERTRALVERAREEVERNERELAARSMSLRRESDRATLGLDRVLSALPSKSALISIACYGKAAGRSYLAFVVGADRSLRAIPLGPADGLDLLIGRWRQLAGKPPEGGAREIARLQDACLVAGRSLRARTWDPLVDHLAGSKLVFVVPDGSFHLLNLVALPAAGGGYLIEAPFVIHYLSAERDIVTDAALPAHGTGLLALGGVAFDAPEARRSPESERPAAVATPPSPESPGAALREGLPDCESFRSVRFKPLPKTAEEVEEITRLWGRSEDVVVLKGESARERSVKDLLPGRRVAHFATHGFFLDGRCTGRGGAVEDGKRGIGGLSVEATHPAPQTTVNPFLLAGLALAGANRREKAGPGEEDGILTAEEIASIDLSGLDWVVLSACDTGVGDVRSGEGVLGLRRAFEVAGAKTLIMSLWAVEDRAARDWMSFLYKGRLERNLETAEAVREADLAVLKSLRAEGRSTLPFYWAGFVAAGGWR